LEAQGPIGFEKLRAVVLREVGEDAEEAIMTAADMLREEGLQKGLKKGHEKGQRELLLKLLSLRFGELPEAVSARVNAADSAQLYVWAERVLSASTLAEILADR
jgi:predicted transposase YdaD